MPSQKWTPEQMPRLDGRTVVVTGANSGIGLTAARQLAAHGARVVLAVRDLARGERAAATISGESEVRLLDLADLSSVRAFADAWTGDLDLLINNAGVMAIPERRTKEGFEMQIGTNHLGHFALTNLLLEHVTGRVVTVASDAHRVGKIDLDDLNWESRSYSPWRAYGQSKLANLLFTRELQRRLTEAGSPVLAVAAHPGYASTNLQSGTASRFFEALAVVGNKLLAQSDEQGAWPTEYAATADVGPAAYIGPDGFREMRGHPGPASSTPLSQDAELGGRLWDLSERLTGVSFPPLVAATR